MNNLQFYLRLINVTSRQFMNHNLEVPLKLETFLFETDTSSFVRFRTKKKLNDFFFASDTSRRQHVYNGCL